MRIAVLGAPTTNGYRAFGIDSSISGGGWVENLIAGLRSHTELEIHIAFYTEFCDKVMFKRNDNVTYYALPIRVKGLTACNAEMISDLKEFYDISSPDVVHIIGTEREHDLRMMEIASPEKTVISITGLVHIYALHYYAGISETAFRKITIGDVIRRGGPIKEKKKFEKWGENEKNLLKKAKYVMGRTTWDYTCVKQVNPNIEYIWCGEIVNDVYHKARWDIGKVQRHRIFVSQASYPLKGLHQIIKALAIILKRFSDTCVYIAGIDILRNDNLMDRIKRTTYASYIISLMREEGIPREAVRFTGSLDAEEMIGQYLQCNVFVLPSAIENSPNSLGEAMMLGVPCVASCVGGVQDMMRDRVDGFIYPFDEPYMLAHYIEQYFENDELCKTMGEQAHMSAMKRFDRDSVVDTTIKTYEQIIHVQGSKNDQSEQRKI